MVRLNEDDPCAVSGRYLSDLLNYGGGDTAPTAVFSYSQIIDVELAPLLLELVKLVSGEATYDFVLLDRRERNEIGLSEQPLQISGAGLFFREGLDLLESLAEHPQQAAHQVQIGWAEPTDFELFPHGHQAGASSRAAFSTSCAWPGTFTFRQARSTLPSRPMR